MAPLALGADRVLLMPTADVSGTPLELEYSYYRGQSIVDLTAGLYPGFKVGIRQEFNGSFSATAKVAVLTEDAKRPGLALGGELSTAGQHVYAVFSKQLGRPDLRGHAGLGTGRYSRGGMAGVTLLLNPVMVKSKQGGLAFPATTLGGAEYDGAGINAGLALQFSRNSGGLSALTGGSGLGFGFNYRTEF